MSFYRIKYYPLREKQYTHLYFKYDRGLVKCNKTVPEQNAKGILEALEKADKSKENLSRARRNVKDIIQCNKFDLFCTFTFSESKIDRYNFDVCSKKIRKLFNNYRNKYSPNFRYIIIPELHKDGAVHFHGMVRGIRECDLTVPDLIPKRDKRTGILEMVPNTKGYVTWSYYSDKLGYFSCSLPKDYEKCSFYVAKYITKDLMNMELGRHLYMCSSGLTRPEIIFDMDGVYPTFSPEFENEFLAMRDSESTLEVLHECWNETCSDIRYPDVEEKEAIFPVLTGEQLHLLGFNGDNRRVV